MKLSYSDEQAMLKDSVDRFLDGLDPVVQLRALRDSSDATGFRSDSWAQMVGQGWPGVASPADDGGSELGQVGLGIIMEGLGRTLCPSPVEATIAIGIPWLAEAGESHRDVLQSAIAGEIMLAAAVQEGAHFSPSTIETRADDGDGGFVIAGRKSHVLDAGVADKLIVTARLEDGSIRTFLVDAGLPGVTVHRLDSIDSRHVGEVEFRDVPVGDAALIGDAGGIPVRVEDVVAAQLAAQLLGLSLRVFAMTCDYLRSREQFGVKIGSFQALQHRAASLFVELETSRALVRAALAALDEDAVDASALASAAKAKLCRVSRLAVNEAIQMHGGIGVTDELDLGLYLKRAMVVQQLFGDANYHGDRFARLRSY